MHTSVSIALASVMLATAAPALAQACEGAAGPGKARLTVEATNLRNAAGEVAFTVYPDDRSKFLRSGGKYARMRVPTRAPVTRGCFWVPPGSYAIAIYHDENGDRDFNRTLIAPKEGFGFSNDAPTSIGLPSLKAVRFAVPAQGRTMRMRMRYRR